MDVGNWLRPSQAEVGAIRPLAAASGVLLLLGAVVAAALAVGLYADGSWFVFAMSAGAPWALKFRDIAGRAAAYLLTVAPVQLAAGLVALSPMQIAALYGFTFYGVQLVLFVVAARLVWDRPDRLLLLLVQFLLGVGLSYGYPSEILVAPGLLWIAAFLVDRDRQLGAGFAAAYLALIFSHELAVPAAAVIGVLAVHRLRTAPDCTRSRLLRLVLVLVLPVAALLVVRSLGGGEGSDFNAIYVFDVRRIANNPTLLVMALAGVAGFGAARLAPRTFPLPALLALLAGFGAALVMALHKLAWGLDFTAGRYPARSLTGGSMVLLALVFARRAWSPRAEAPALSDRRPWLLPVLCAAAGAAMAAHLLFLVDWRFALAGDRRLAAATAGAPRIVDYDDALATLPPREAAANRRSNLTDFVWVMPYRTMVLADGSTPARIVQGAPDWFFCSTARRTDFSRSVLSPRAVEAWRGFTCAHPVDHTQTPLGQKLRHLLDIRSWTLR